MKRSLTGTEEDGGNGQEYDSRMRVRIAYADAFQRHLHKLIYMFPI